MSKTHLTIVKLFAYSAPALPLAAFGIMFYVFLPKFYSDVVGIDVRTLGLIILLSRVWDAVSDPLIGSLSDQTQSRYGRRLVWLRASAIPLIVVFILLSSTPKSLSNTAAIIWLAVGTFLFFLSWTSFTIPYEALGTELVDDYDQRTRLYAVRQGGVVLGTLLSSVLPALFDQVPAFRNFFPSERERIFATSIFFALLFAVASFACVTTIVEEPKKIPRTSGSLKRALASAFKNKPFLILLTSYTVSGFGSALPATLIFYYVQYVLGSTHAPLFLLLYFTVGFVFLPLWVKLSTLFGKKEAWIASMMVNTCAFIGVLFLGRGDGFLYGLLVALSAVGYGGTLAIPYAMQADVLDLEEFERGSRREGEFIGLWSICSKLSAALGAGVALPILGLVGYIPNVEQSSTTVLTISILYAGVPCVCNLVAAAITLKYPIDRLKHQAIAQALIVRRDALQRDKLV